jgi:hypothetical protein
LGLRGNRGLEEIAQFRVSGFLYISPNIIRVIKSSRMGWVVHVAHMGERRVA